MASHWKVSERILAILRTESATATVERIAGKDV
jgi:hypothetical protein